MLQNMTSAKPVNLINSMANAADAPVASSKTGADATCSKEVAQKKTAADGAAQAESDQPQMFEQLLSNANAAQKPADKAPVAKAKTSDAADAAKTEPAATPDIALLMSLLPALPPSELKPDSCNALAAPVADDALSVAPVATTATSKLASTTTPGLPQMPAANATDDSKPAVIAATVASTVPSGEIRSGDKPDLFAAVLATPETPTPTASPMLAVPTHQAPTLTAVAQALPVTAPGSLDELPISHREWPAALGHRMVWAVGEGIQKVELSVSPQDMGPIKVHIRIENDQADIRFTAAHAMTRDVLESSIPKLRDMFSQQGLNLSQAQVFSQNSHDTRGQQPDANANPASSSTRNGDTAEALEPELARPMTMHRGLVDDYA